MLKSGILVIHSQVYPTLSVVTDATIESAAVRALSENSASIQCYSNSNNNSRNAIGTAPRQFHRGDLPLPSSIS